MKTNIRNACKQINKNFKVYIYCTEKLQSEWVYIAIQDLKTGLYYTGYNTIDEFSVRDFRNNMPTISHVEARNRIANLMK